MTKWIMASLVVLVLSLTGIAALALFLWWLLSRLGEEPIPEVVEIEIEDEAPDAGEGVPYRGPEETLSADELLPEPDVEPEEASVDVEVDATIEEAQVTVDDEMLAEAEPEAPDLVESASEVEPDDLKRIEGIGPKISSVLQAAGISTFSQLASADVASLEQILEAESPRLRRLANPGTWPAQAKLAEAGDWDGLAAFQGTLRAGRPR
ncbi:helix-hairpin-helix domain-containing protein [Chloroflexota bacterium]